MALSRDGESVKIANTRARVTTWGNPIDAVLTPRNFTWQFAASPLPSDTASEPSLAILTPIDAYGKGRDPS